MKFKGLIVVLCVLSSLIVNAQELEHNNRFKDKLALKVEYFGELVLHPGIVVGFDYTVVKKKMGNHTLGCGSWWILASVE